MSLTGRTLTGRPWRNTMVQVNGENGLRYVQALSYAFLHSGCGIEGLCTWPQHPLDVAE
jgi:hypothetical protein